MLKDAHGNVIKVGDTVRHLISPENGNDPRRFHEFHGEGTVRAVVGPAVCVKRVDGRGGIPVYAGALLVVENGVDGRVLATE